MNLFTGNIYWNIYWHPQKRLGFPSFRNLLKQFWYIFHDSSTMDSYLACPVDRWLQPWCASHKYSHKERIQPDRVLINNGGFKLFNQPKRVGLTNRTVATQSISMYCFPSRGFAQRTQEPWRKSCGFSAQRHHLWVIGTEMRCALPILLG